MKIHTVLRHKNANQHKTRKHGRRTLPKILKYEHMASHVIIASCQIDQVFTVNRIPNDYVRLSTCCSGLAQRCELH
jgi:hypothetical protein